MYICPGSAFTALRLAAISQPIHTPCSGRRLVSVLSFRATVEAIPGFLYPTKTVAHDFEPWCCLRLPDLETPPCGVVPAGPGNVPGLSKSHLMRATSCGVRGH